MPPQRPPYYAGSIRPRPPPPAPPHLEPWLQKQGIGDNFRGPVDKGGKRDQKDGDNMGEHMQQRYMVY